MAATPSSILSPTRVLHPGDVFVAERGARLETLLGSCVAIILTDPRRTIGAMCHIVHSGSSDHQNAVDTAHADPALRTLFALLRARGINPSMCDAFVYGGGNMFPNLFEHAHVGCRNSEWALDTLSRLGMPVIDQDVGGTTYRKLSWTVGVDAPRVDAIEV